MSWPCVACSCAPYAARIAAQRRCIVTQGSQSTILGCDTNQCIAIQPVLSLLPYIAYNSSTAYQSSHHLSRYTGCIVTHSQTKLPPVMIQFVVSRHGPPACLVSAPVTIQLLYRDTPHPGCPYCDTIAAPTTIQSLYRDTALPPGQI